ncbi:hypothetical protein J2TS6_55040 [Paenibacillus albilobatus]|uniref:Uncharacterized protein n=1 Tax=Paenibacillus albilobatus TaxID=2716884 RepID=A0A920CE13_9BACL|nr:hypothetical protein [Paenibacillus albilobatus]GIO34363.1 hypothetical protein J2TS6_55040 [Paenibacillus albilobatus]
MFDVKVYLKTGQIVEFTTKQLGVKKDQGERIDSLSWDVNADTEKFSLHHIEVDQIVAITAKYREVGTV